MVSELGSPGQSSSKNPFGLDSVLIRIAILGVLVVVAFVALFSRLWFLQVLAANDYSELARDNRVRTVYSEPPRGRILDRNGEVLVQNRSSLAVTVDRQIVDTQQERRTTLRRLSKLLESERKTLKKLLDDQNVSPYKPVAVAYDIDRNAAIAIKENQEDYPGVGIERLPVREYPQGEIAAQVLGYVGEISLEDLKSSRFKGVKPAYQAGDIVGKMGVERSYDRFLRGKPRIEKVVVNAGGDVIHSAVRQEEQPGRDLVLSIDARIQTITELALKSGIGAARGAGYNAPDGAAVVMDPVTGEVIASASFPTFDPAMLADGLSQDEFDRLGQATPDDPTDDALLNRVTQSGSPPGSTFKVVTAGAAIANGVIGPYDSIDCDPVFTYGLNDETFNNWTSADLGPMSLARSLEVSCDTYYYELGARMEDRWGAGNGDGSERFQAFMRKAGFGSPTGIDIPGETSGTVPDEDWLDELCKVLESEGCQYGWLPGYTVNMSIGQGDVTVSPIQMAVYYSAILNEGKIIEPRIGLELVKGGETVRQIKTKTKNNLGLDPSVYEVMREGLEDVVSGDEGTARSAFAGFPLEKVQVAGKTGTAQIGTTDRNFAWFVSYAPAEDPQYVVAVYLNQAGHGGESAGPVAREIFEGIFNLDNETEVTLGTDQSD